MSLQPWSLRKIRRIATKGRRPMRIGALVSWISWIVVLLRFFSLMCMSYFAIGNSKDADQPGVADVGWFLRYLRWNFLWEHLVTLLKKWSKQCWSCSWKQQVWGFDIAFRGKAKVEIHCIQLHHWWNIWTGIHPEHGDTNGDNADQPCNVCRSAQPKSAFLILFSKAM